MLQPELRENHHQIEVSQMTNVMGVIIKYFRLTKTQTLHPYQTFCTSKYENLWTGLLYGYKGFLLLFCTYLAWETRKVHMPALNDSKQIGFAVYNVFIPCVIIIPILNLLRSHSDAVYLLSTLLCLFCTTITQCLIFVPKVSTRSYLLLEIDSRRQNHNCKKKFPIIVNLYYEGIGYTSNG